MVFYAESSTSLTALGDINGVHMGSVIITTLVFGLIVRRTVCDFCAYCLASKFVPCLIRRKPATASARCPIVVHMSCSSSRSQFVVHPFPESLVRYTLPKWLMPESVTAASRAHREPDDICHRKGGGGLPPLPNRLDLNAMSP